MAGHSKRHNIKHKKAKEDAKKAKVYSKIAKLITVAARGGADASMNPALEQALQKARYNSLPKEVVEKAINKGAGLAKSGGDFSEILYEGYGPGGVALLIKSLTDNTNRTSGVVRLLLQKGGGSIAKPGAVAWQFQEKGVIQVNGLLQKSIDKGRPKEELITYDAEEFELFAMDLAIETVETIGEYSRIVTDKENFLTVCEAVTAAHYNISQADLEYLADNTIQTDEEIVEKCNKLVDTLEEDDDIDTVFSNIADV